MIKQTNVNQNVAHHYVRTTFAALFGILALVLVLASILVVWANRTLTDTPTYVSAVAPLVKQAAVKDFVAEKVADQLEQSAPTEDLATLLLAADQATGKTPEQLKSALTPVIHAGVVQVMQSPNFADLWKSTNQNNHAELIRQLDANSPEITLDLGPFVTGVTQDIKLTKLAPIADKLKISSSDAKLDLKGSQIVKVHTFYKLFKTATVAIVIITLLAAGLCVWISVHHSKTLRRMVIGTGVIALVVAGLIMLPSTVKLASDDPVTQKAVLAVAATLLHNLQIACLATAVTCFVVAAASKVYDRRRAA